MHNDEHNELFIQVLPACILRKEYYSWPFPCIEGSFRDQLYRKEILNRKMLAHKME